MGVEDEDWRLTNQAAYLSGVALQWRAWFGARRPHPMGDWDHDHCAFCWAHFGEQAPDQLAGYVTDDGLHWICSGCYADFKDRFRWVVTPT